MATRAGQHDRRVAGVQRADALASAGQCTARTTGGVGVGGMLCRLIGDSAGAAALVATERPARSATFILTPAGVDRPDLCVAN